MYHETGLIALHVVSDLLIALAYFSIPIALIYFARRRKDLSYNWMFLLFALFIVLCGTTHIFGVLSIWHAMYRLDGIIKLLTAIASIGTAIILWRLMPGALALPSLKQITRRRDELEELVDQRTSELTKVNHALRQSEENLKAVVEKARSANQAKSDFLANISHELRTPLSVIVGISDILIRQQDLPHKSRELVEVQQSSARTLKALINDLLDISKIEARNLKLMVQSFNINQLSNDVIKVFRLGAEEKSLKLEFIPAKEDLNLIGDPARIRQIITNLVSNAIKFTDQGTITLSIEILPETDAEQRKLQVSVEDTGIGMSASELDSIFERFSQLDSSKSRKYAGTGLGLAISRDLAQLMGGALTATSEQGKGSHFTLTITLPVSHDTAQNNTGAESSETGTKPDKSRPCILAVDDYPANLMVLENILDDMGYNCITAKDGKEALEQVKAEYDNLYAVLMDLQMPEMDGIEATRHIRDLEKTTKSKRHLPIIAITAHALRGTEEECLKAGMDLYLSKPYQRERLAELLEKCTAIAEKR